METGLYDDVMGTKNLFNKTNAKWSFIAIKEYL